MLESEGASAYRMTPNLSLKLDASPAAQRAVR